MNIQLKSEIMMRNVVLMFAFLFMAWMSVNAQSNFRPGYVITNEQDTIYGLINFGSYQMNAEVCHFMSDKNEVVTSYYPGSIYGYRFTDDGKYYVSKTIEIEGMSKNVFLEYLIQGIISLYFYPKDGYINEDFGYYFFQDESGRMIPVTKRNSSDEYIVKRSKDNDFKEWGKRYYLEDERYKGIVSYIFKESGSISQAASKMTFRRDDMIDLTKKYHAEMCTVGEECIQFETLPDKYVKTRMSVYAGLRMQTLDENPVWSPEIGVQANFSIPRWNKSISLQVDASCTYFNDDTIENKKHSGWIVTGKLGGKYTYHKGSFRPLIEGGLAMNYMHSTYVYFPYTNQFNEKNSHGLLNGYYAGTGFDYHFNKDRDNALIFRIVYDSYMLLAIPLIGEQAWSALQIKLGYTF